MVPLQGVIGREGDHQLSGSGRGAIAGCHCSVLWVGEEGDQLWGVVRLQGAIVVCYGVEREGCRPTLGMDVVPLQGAIVVGCRCDDRAIAGCPWQPT